MAITWKLMAINGANYVLDCHYNGHWILGISKKAIDGMGSVGWAPWNGSHGSMGSVDQWSWDPEPNASLG